MKGFGTVGWIILVAVILGGGYALTMNSSEEKMESMEHDSMMEEDAMMSEEDSMMMEKEDAMMEDGSMMMAKYEGAVLAGGESPLLDFVQSDYEKALASDKLVVLYFYATWCPFCREEAGNALEPAFSELEGDDVIGFRVNYNDGDTDEYEKALAREHGIAYQHTKVFIKNGERILKAPDTWDKERYHTEITNALK
ncbi:thioredoxin family protein [Candidatus Kaiserbacteria bacterium]|nr:thioredoxin family protein [Candidatus Kaiserbacteria bacterium]